MLLLSLAAGCSVHSESSVKGAATVSEVPPPETSPPMTTRPSIKPSEAPATPEPTPEPTPKPTARPEPSTSPTAKPRPTQQIDTALIGRGYATYYDAPSRRDAAAGPALRAWLGDNWRGTKVWISLGEKKPIWVRLTDWCACRDRHGKPTLIDLDERAFSDLGDLSRGILLVEVSK